MVDHSSKMMMLWVPLLHLICVGFAEEDVINIGAVFSFGSINGKVAKIAMAAAIHDVNSDPTILPASKIVLSMHDSNYSGFLGIIGGKFFVDHFSFQISIFIHIFHFKSKWVHSQKIIHQLSFTVVNKLKIQSFDFL